MKNILLKEITSIVKAPFFYILLAFFALITGWIFFNFFISYVENLQSLPMQHQTPLAFYSSVVFKFYGNLNILFIFITPLMTMKSFAFEFEKGTIDIYFQAPVKDWGLVFAKYFASLLSLVLILSTTVIFVLVLYFVGLSDFTFIWTSYLALICNLVFYASIGVLCSALTRNTLMAGFMSFVVIMFFWMISWGLNISNDYFLVENLKFFSVITHFEKILQGNFSFGDFYYYISFSLLFLFFAKKKLESRLWSFK